MESVDDNAPASLTDDRVARDLASASAEEIASIREGVVHTTSLPAETSDAESLRIHDAITGVTYAEFTSGFEITAAAIPPGDGSIILGTSEGLCTIPLASREQVQADFSQQSSNRPDGRWPCDEQWPASCSGPRLNIIGPAHTGEHTALTDMCSHVHLPE